MLFDITPLYAAQLPTNEKDWQREVIETAELFGCTRYFHMSYALGADRGYPDLTLILPWGIVWLELKGPRSQIQDEQIAWVLDLQNAGSHAYIARVSHANRNAIVALFRGQLPYPDPLLDAGHLLDSHWEVYRDRI